MRLMRWYIRQLGMGGVIAVSDGESEKHACGRVAEYVNETLAKDEPRTTSDKVSLWNIENDDDYSPAHPGVVATNY